VSIPIPAATPALTAVLSASQRSLAVVREAVRDERQWSRAADASAERLGFATLAYVVATTLVITMAPFRFSSHSLHGLSMEWTTFDLVMNGVMFVPLGFLYRVTRPRGATNAWWIAIVLGAMLSTSIEAAQLFSATRYSSLLDVLTNTSGAAVGSLLFTRLSHRLRVGASAVSALALELPLIGVVYLLVPLLWLTGLASSGSERAWLLLPMTIFGGALIGAVHGAYLEPAQRSGAFGLIAVSGGWAAIASIPGGRGEPLVIGAAIAVAMGSAWLRSTATKRARLLLGPHRFELATLRLVLPLFAVYLALSALWPLDAASDTWRAGLELFPALHGELSQRLVFQALEYLSTFTVAGYLIAEFHGRTNDGYHVMVGRVVCWGGGMAGMLELARGWHAQFGASILVATLAITASVFGGWLYHLQRDHVRALWARDRGSSTAYLDSSASSVLASAPLSAPSSAPSA